MKRFMTLVFAMLFIVLITSCGDDKKTDEKLPDSETTDEDVVDEDPTDNPDNPDSDNPDTTPDNSDSDNPDTTPDNPDSDNPDTTPDNPDSDNPDTTPDDTDTGDDADTDVVDDTDSGDDEDTDTGIIDEGDTECTYIPNAFVSNWTDNMPTGYVGKSGTLYEKIDRGERNYALRAYMTSQPTKNFYAFDAPIFTTAADAAVPAKITFDLAMNKVSKVSINIRCGEVNALQDNSPMLAYNWDSDSETFVENGKANKYYQVDLGNTNFRNVEMVMGEGMTADFWQNKDCRLEFKYGQKKDTDTTPTYFDIKVDNIIIHTATRDCIGEDIPDEGDTTPDEGDTTPDEGDTTPDEGDTTPDEGDTTPDEGDTTPDEGDTTPDDEGDTTPDDEGDTTPDEGDTTPDDEGDTEPSCVQIPNGKATNWNTLLEADDNSWGHGTRVTYTTVDGALNIVHSTSTGNDTVLDSEKFMTSADDDNIPIGIRFKLATIKPSKLAVSFHWGTGNTYTYYAYNWDETKKRFFLDPTPTKHNTYDYTKVIDLGDTDFHEVEIVFGDEITEEIWHNTTKSKFIRLKTGKDTDDFEIRVKDFEFVYYGSQCKESEHYNVGWATIEYPKDLTGANSIDTGMPQTFYGRVFIDGLTNQTMNKSEFLMGVRAQFGSRPRNADMDYEWKEAEINEAYNDGTGIGNAFGGNDEYKYTTKFEAGEYEYAFRFSADNGKTWKKTSEFPDEGDHTGTAYANVNALPKDVISNGDFSRWISDKEPWLWTTADGSFEKETSSENPALKVLADKGSGAKSVLKSHTFEISDTAARPQKIALKLATYQDNKLTISILLDCGENSKFYYKWNTTGKYFERNTQNQFAYKNLEINFGNNNLNDTWIDTSAITAENWNGKTCYLEFKFGEDKNNDRWAIFDDITIVPAE